MVEPGMQPPEGMVSNFDNPDREMYYLCIVSNVVGIVVCTVFMGLRFWARYRLSMRLQADDSRFRGSRWVAFADFRASRLHHWICSYENLATACSSNTLIDWIRWILRHLPSE